MDYANLFILHLRNDGCERTVRQVNGPLDRGVGAFDRRAGLKGYCTGLMLLLARKSVEPMAARVDPVRSQQAGVLERLRFATKAEIALA